MQGGYDSSAQPQGAPQAIGPVDMSPDPYGDDLLERLIEDFEEGEEASYENRQLVERDVDYYDNKQFTAEEKRQILARGQAPIFKNRIRRKIKYMLGYEQAQRTKATALPRNPSDEDDAHAAQDAIRAVCDMNRYDQIRSAVWKDLVSAGYGGVEVIVEEKKGQKNPRVVIRRIPWDRLVWDPYSAEVDFEDSIYRPIVLWMDRDEAIRRYGPEAEDIFDSTLSATSNTNTYDDKPKLHAWVDRLNRVRVRVVQMYFLDKTGGWSFAEFTKGGILNVGPSPWLDEDGEPEHPHVWRSANIDRDNQRYGMIREMIPLQDEVNKRSIKALHVYSTRQIYRQEGALGKMTPRKMRQQLTRPDGEITLAPGIEWGKHIGVIETGDMANGQLELLQDAKAEMDLIGANAAMQGKGNTDASGRAILASQSGGQIEAGPEMDILRDMDREVYHKIWRRIRQFWTAEEWVRVTDDMKNIKFVGLNVQARQLMQDPMTGQTAVDPRTGQAMSQPIIDPLTGQPVIAKADVSKLDLDIIIEDAPPVGATETDEQLKTMVSLAPAGVKFKPEVYLSMSTLRNKQQLIQMQAEQQNQPPNPLEQANAVAEIKDKQASATEKQANAVKATADAQHRSAQAKHLTVTTASELANIAHTRAKTRSEHIAGSAGAVDIIAALRGMLSGQPPQGGDPSQQAAPDQGGAPAPQTPMPLPDAGQAPIVRPSPGGMPVRAPDGQLYIHAPHANGQYQRVVLPQ